MLDYLWESLFPPYETYDIILFLILILLAVSVFCMAADFVGLHKISRFFAAHKTETGKVIKYEILQGQKYITTSPLAPGVSAVIIPRTHQSPDQYSVVLECHGGNRYFQARYSISADEYKKHKVGETIQIEDNWDPVGFRCL